MMRERLNGRQREAPPRLLVAGLHTSCYQTTPRSHLCLCPPVAEAVRDKSVGAAYEAQERAGGAVEGAQVGGRRDGPI